MIGRQQLSQLYSASNGIVPQLMILMFVSSVGRGFTTPYVNLYLDHIGASGTVIGSIVGLVALVELFVSPFLNNLADKYRRHRFLLKIQYLFFAIGSFLLATTQNLVFVAMFVVLIELGKRSAIVLSIQLTLVRLEQIERAILGRIRGFNALGFSAANLIQGIIYTASGYLGMFIWGGIFSLMAVWYTRALPREATTHQRDNTMAPRKRKFYFFVLIQIFVQLGALSGFTFWLIHFTNNLGIYPTDIGLIIAIGALAEFPFFVMFDSIVRRFDVRLVYTLGAFGLSLIWLVTGIIPSPIWVIPWLIGRGFSFALLNMSTHILISRISDPRNVATNQALLQITVPGVATLFGAPLMGWIYDHQPAPIYFALCMLLMIVGALIMVIVYRYMTPTLIEADSTPKHEL